MDKIDADLDNDLLHVRYDAAKATPAEMMKVIAKQGFEAKMVSGPAPAG